MRRRRLDRFGRLEAERRPVRAAPQPPGSSRVEARFRSGAEAAAVDAEPSPPTSQGRSGGQPARFETPTVEEPPLRVLDVENSQPFVRCAECRADGHATSVRCQHCGSDLTTREQRAFNEALWKRRLQEKAEEEREVERLRTAREEADREMAEAFRLRAALEQDLERRMALGILLERPGAGADAIEVSGRRVGEALGRWFRRSFPERRTRIAVLGALAAISVVVLVASAPARWVVFGALALAAIARLEIFLGRR
jgi:hypothetical protein